ncbi:hypothetical protein UR09_06190 [Candidatus Nitromaritima sp. SCGC AAA799-A02]|nr:hypothetical protein UR09_06190 [Candidatus Nitromaritima sp. SCGC AAA799-A02]KMP11779.1 hypothetical protein UZ36_03210 [Candidatus Nitromaritima sp. SCGC AAA799-C22]
MSKQRLMQTAGGVWGSVGIFLIYRGIGLYQMAAEEQNSSQGAILLSFALGIVLGIIKGRFVLAKTARRNRDRIRRLEPPFKIHNVFSAPFYGFIAGMMLLGFLMRTFNTYLGGYVVVAAVYCGIGMALLAASLVYWKDEPQTPAEGTS